MVSRATLPSPALPIDLIRQAQHPLPDSTHLFQEALLGPDNLDESDLWRWKDGPPYVVESTSTANARPEGNYTERLVEVMHGVRLCKQHREDEARHYKFWEEDRTAALEGLCVEVDGMLKEWKTLTLFLHHYSAGAREITMAKIYLQWLARTIYHLHYLLFL